MNAPGRRFEGKGAIVIGAADAHSIGGAIATRSSEEGARVLIASRRGDKLRDSPGLTESPMTGEFLAIPGLRRSFEEEIAMGRLNTVHDVAAAVLWVSSDEACLTGQNLHPSGGNTLRRLPNVVLGTS